MKTNKNQRKRLLAHCGELHEEDGADPRRFFQHDRSRRQGNRKAMQLCSQVARTLDLLLAGEFADEALQGLQVVSVRPAPDTSRLCVTLRADLVGTGTGVAVILDRLAKVAGRLRSEVAAAITRKRAPRLVFQLLESDADREETV